MKEASLNAIRIALKAALGELQKFPEVPTEEHWVYQRNSQGGWNGAVVSKPSVRGLIVGRYQLFEKLAGDVEQILSREYPEHLKAVGTQLSVGILQPPMILNALAYDAYRRFGTFVLTDDQTDRLLADVSSFFDRKTMRFNLSAPALNLHGSREVAPMEFPGEITLRPITDEEFTSFYGGNPFYQSRRTPLSAPTFVFTKDVELPKVVGTFDAVQGDCLRPAVEALERAVLALATFKDAGAVGYDGIRIAPSEFAMGAAFGTHHQHANEHVPLSRYELTPEEAPQVQAHAKLFENIHPTLEMACLRLVDGSRRTKSRDAIIDAVIGLESILLAGTDRRELGFRFSLNYATLFPKEERRAAYRTARCKRRRQNPSVKQPIRSVAPE